MSEKPAIPYRHLWTDSDGISRQRQCAMLDFELKSIDDKAEPQWQGRKISGSLTEMVTVLPVGWIGEWHDSPKPQWIVPLSGRWFVEAMDGTRVEIGAGEISFGGDQHCREVDGRRGHRSGTVGEVPAALVLIQLDDAPAPRPPVSSGDGNGRI